MIKHEGPKKSSGSMISQLYSLEQVRVLLFHHWETSLFLEGLIKATVFWQSKASPLPSKKYLRFPSDIRHFRKLQGLGSSQEHPPARGAKEQHATYCSLRVRPHFRLTWERKTPSAIFLPLNTCWSPRILNRIVEIISSNHLLERWGTWA